MREHAELHSSLWPVQVLLTIVSLAATMFVRPGILTNFSKWPIGYLIPVVVAGSLVYLLIAQRQKNDKGAFLASCGYIVGMLVGAAFALYPNVLPASTDPELQSDHLQHRYGCARNESGLRMVEDRDGLGARLLRFHLPHVSRQSARGRGRQRTRLLIGNRY